MAKTVIGEHGHYTLDHPCFREVYETTYIEDVITDIQIGDDAENSLLNLPNTCTLESSGILPVFYNCRKGYYTEKTGQRVGEDLGISKGVPEESLFDGVKAFEVGQSVKVLCEQGEPKYVVGHTDHVPRMCVDIFKMKIHHWNGKDYYIYYIGDEAGEYCEPSLSDSCGDPDGMFLNEVCTEEGHILFGQREFQAGTIMNYWGDFFVKVGPIMYILKVDSIGLPGMFTGNIQLHGAIWTEELETECDRLGRAAEETIGGAFDPVPTRPVYPSEVKLQRGFTKAFYDRFRGFKLFAPRWVFTKLWGEKL
jgi:hypothetical protein